MKGGEVEMFKKVLIAIGALVVFLPQASHAMKIIFDGPDVVAQKQPIELLGWEVVWFIMIVLSAWLCLRNDTEPSEKSIIVS